MKNWRVKIEKRPVDIVSYRIMQFGFGRKKIVVELKYREAYQYFEETTNDLEATDTIKQVGGQVCLWACYKLIEEKIKNQVIEWIYRIDSEEPLQ
jgi:hypothetical protein